MGNGFVERRFCRKGRRHFQMWQSLRDLRFASECSTRTSYVIEGSTINMTAFHT